MDTPQEIRRATQLLLHVDGLAQRGITRREIDSAVSASRLVRVRPGWYVEASQWQSGRSEQKHLLAILAAQQSTLRRPILSHRSAATLHGLPVWSRWMTRTAALPQGRADLADERSVDLTVGPSEYNAGSSATARHRAALPSADTTQIAGLRLTSGERTVFDLARSEPFPVALACADAYLRGTIRVGRLVDRASWNAWREQLVSRADAMPRGRGMAAVRALAVLADPRSDSPLESVSRLRALQLGLTPELQVAVPNERGGSYYLDLLFRELGVFGECDGKAKYTDPALRNGRSADEVVYSEKRRHDWIEGSQGWRGVRWGAPEVSTAASFARHLRAQRVRVPGRPSLVLGPGIARFLRQLGP
ncbi:hypothetical protein [Leucobacter luti]|uniref:hypothetical protein n=1 Tax=Leucobacter luti TaxID=340320 RepID=UPI00104BF261|nr:hypothetical protein [Leucobacter luti]MCW2288238.1 hypothetical protein [Leucobacter luti]